MPAFNAERTIAGAINSILTQTYEDWELIIIDDGSTDQTQTVLSRFTDPRVRVFNISHGGIAQARNHGNKHARSDICIVQDADDYSLPNRLERVAECFRETDADIVVHSGYVNAWDTQYNCISRHYLKAEIGEEAALKNRILGWPAYKKSVWQAKPFRLETKYAYDWMMHLDWTLSGFKYAAIDEGLYEYIRYQGSASDRFEKSGQRAEAFKLIKDIVKKEYNRSISLV